MCVYEEDFLRNNVRGRCSLRNCIAVDTRHSISFWQSGTLGAERVTFKPRQMDYMSRTTLVSDFASQTLSLFWSWHYLYLSLCLLTGASVETGDVYLLLYLLLWRSRGHMVVFPFLIKAVKSRVQFKHYIKNPREISYAYIETTHGIIQY